MEGIGEILREARERKNVSFEEIEDTTKIKKRYLLAMELEEWSRMPGKVYAKGFLRTYARYLGLDEQSIADLFELSLAAREPDKAELSAVPAEKKRKARRRRKQPEVDLHNKPKKRMVYVLCILSVILIVFVVWAYKTYYLDEIEAEKQAPPPIVLPQPEPAPPPFVVEPDPEPVVLTAFAIQLEATENCWLRLRDGGELVYEDTMRKGEIREFEDIGAIELRIGNAGGLLITLNGLSLPPTGSSGQIVTKHFSIVDGVMMDDDTGEVLS